MDLRINAQLGIVFYIKHTFGFGYSLSSITFLVEQRALIEKKLMVIIQVSIQS